MIEFKWEVEGCKVDRSIFTFLLDRNLKKFQWTFKPIILKILWVQFYRRVGMVLCCNEEWSIGTSGELRNDLMIWGNHCHPVSESSSIRINQTCFTNQTFDTVLSYLVSGIMFWINKMINWKFPLSVYEDASYLTRTETSATQLRERKNLQNFKPIKGILSVSLYG